VWKATLDHILCSVKIAIEFGSPDISLWVGAREIPGGQRPTLGIAPENQAIITIVGYWVRG
jgi:hypothetical protein